MSLKCTSRVAIFEDSNVYGRHLILPDEVAHNLLESIPSKRVIYQINGGPDLHAGIMSAGDYYYLLLNQEICKKHKLQEDDVCEIELRADDSKYGMPMPRELEEYLIQEPQASQYFEALTPGKQRNLIYIVSKLKSTDKRVEKSHVIVQHLISQKGKLDHKLLYQEFRDYGK